MEIGKAQIARLVLGYLKNENCSNAFNEFLTTSQYLKQQALFIKNGKYFATRVGGLTLEDIIREYSEISFIIQGKLEQTSYYEEDHKMNLVDQLIYIFDNPLPTSPTLSKDLNTTPSESLPGNSIEPENMGNISQILSHSLLEKSELHEKLADAINSVRNTSQVEDIQAENAGKELDNKIKTIVQKAEQDPIFDKILYELIDKNPDLPDQSTSKNSSDNSHCMNWKPSDAKMKMNATSSRQDERKCLLDIPRGKPTGVVRTSSPTVHNSAHTSSLSVHTSNSTIQPSTPSGDGSTLALYTSNPTFLTSTPGVHTSTPAILSATAAVLPSVPTVLTSTPTILSSTPTVPTSTPNVFTSTPGFLTSTSAVLTSTSAVLASNPAVPTPTPNSSSEVIIYRGNLDTYVGNTGTMAASQSGQIYVANTPGLLMVPSMITTPNYLIVNSQTNTMSSVLTDTDIMKMPTVILDEGLSSKQPQVTVPQLEPSRITKQLVPKVDGISVSTTSGDYLAVYGNDGQIIVSDDSGEPKRRKELRKKLPRQAKLKKKEPTPKREEHKSPSTPVNKLNVKKSTPRSGSHVRTLNFTTPSKEKEYKKDSDSSNGKKKNKASKKASKKKIEHPISSWDADLRELLIPKTAENGPSPDTSDDKLDLTCEDDEELENEARLIEDAFKTPIKQPEESPPKQADLPKKEEDEEEEKIVTIEVEEEDEKVDAIESVAVEETEVYLRNINAPPKFKKKCNILSNYPVQKCEIEVVIERSEVIERHVSESIKKNLDQKESLVNSAKHIILETPVKTTVPKTPGKSELTPFSRALEEQLQGMDLLQIETPNILATPSFPLTPGMGLNSPLPANRPTDYSTSSSYYQPSDTEQNKSLELMIEECRKLEKKSLKTHENRGIKIEDLDNSNQVVSNVSEIKRAFNENVIGKKNLNLMKQRSPSSGSSDDSNSSSSTSDSTGSDSDSEYDPSENEQVVVKNYNYCLRTRRATIDADENLSKPSTSKTPSKIKSVVEEIEDKRERVMKSLKNDVKNVKATPKTNQLRDKVNKITKKSSSRRKSRTPMKKFTPKCIKQISKICEVENEITDDDFALHLSTDEETLNKSSLESTANKNHEQPVEKVILKTDKETPSDLEAEKLVQGLKERGIHLVHKKSPKKSSDMSLEEELKPEQNDTKEKNKVVSKYEDIISDNGTNQKKNEVEILNSVNVDSSLDISSNALDVTFDIQNFEEENLRIEYNSKKKGKKVVYNAKVLEKEMKANVYIESLDIEMERIIKCTLFDAIFDFIPKSSSAETKKKTNTERHKIKVESLISTKEGKRNKEKKDKQKKAEIKKDNAEAVVKEDALNKAKSSTNDGNLEKCDSKKSESKEGNLEIKKNDVGDVKVVNSVNRTQVEESCSNNEGFLNMGMERSPGLRASDDELMNYAIIGSQREENTESPRSGNKRKYSSSDENEPGGKKCKTEQQQALLKKIDVDMFLNKVHGNVAKY